MGLGVCNVSQCRNPIHKAHYELFIRALDAPNVGEEAVCLVHPTCGPTQARTAEDSVKHVACRVWGILTAWWKSVSAIARR